MAFDIITVQPTINAGAYTERDVFFDITSFNLPARSCKLVNAFIEVPDSGLADGETLHVLFFQDNAGGNLASSGINNTANISIANFTLNKYIGTIAMFCEENQQHPSAIDNMGFFHGASAVSSVGLDSGDAATRRDQSLSDVSLILKANKDVSTSDHRYQIFVAAVTGIGTIDLASATSCKLHLHVEY